MLDRLRGDIAEVLAPEALELDALPHNIRAARINLCLAVDSIDRDLRRLVEYLNRVTVGDVRVTALQLSYARHGELEILIPSTFGGEIATAKTRATRLHWTRETFLDSIASAEDRQLAEWYFDQVEAPHERRGRSEPIWFGSRPGGGLFLRPDGLRYAPLQLGVSSAGRLVLSGNWNSWGSIAGHDGFAGLAALLGQDHHGHSRSVPADALDRTAVWDEVLRCAEAVNQAAV